MDLEKAFDYVPHHLLWEVLQDYGVPRSILWGICSLYERSEGYVCHLTVKSKLFELCIRLSQGYALSPVCGFHVQDIKIQPRMERCPVWNARDSIPAI